MHIILVYIGVLLGMFVEGEMIMISAVIAAHHGYLNLWMVIILGVLGTYGSDLFYFSLGRKKGRGWLKKNKKIEGKLSVVDEKIKKYPVLIFLIYRFLYGFRTIIPMVIGASKTRTPKFLIYSGVSTVIWATVYCTLGYLMGAFIKSQLGHIEHIEKYIIGILVLAGLLIVTLKSLKKDKEPSYFQD